MYVRLAIYSMVGRILFAFGTEDFIHHRYVLREHKQRSSKNSGPSDRPQKQNGDFLENGSNTFD
jgi:hypothetical protein